MHIEIQLLINNDNIKNINAESTLLGYILLNNVPFESGHVIDKLMACTFTVDCVVDVTLS